jgi:hypothetical protein
LTVEGTQVTVSTGCFAKGIVLSCDDSGVQFSDNYFDLLPGEQRTVELLPLHPDEPIPEISPLQVAARSFYDMLQKA